MKASHSNISKIAIITGLSLGAFALAAIAGTWTPPSLPPPQGNVPGPVYNLGSTAQSTSTGLLALSALVFNQTCSSGTCGHVDDNQVLTSTGGNGTASWQSLSVAQSSPLCNTVYVGALTAGNSFDMEAIPLTINGTNICIGTTGCAVYIWDQGTISSTHAAIDFYGSYKNVYRQFPLAGTTSQDWLFAQSNNVGTNGDGIAKGLLEYRWVHGTDGTLPGIAIYDDMTYHGSYQHNVSVDNSKFIVTNGVDWSEHDPNYWTIDNNSSHYFEVSVCTE